MWTDRGAFQGFFFYAAFVCISAGTIKETLDYIYPHRYNTNIPTWVYGDKEQLESKCAVPSFRRARAYRIILGNAGKSDIS